MEKIKEEKKMKKLLALLLASTMVLSMAACGQKSDAPAATGENSASQAAAGDSEGTYTYHDSVSMLSTNWNPHTHQSVDDAYPLEFLNVGLYSFIFNDELHPVEGKEPYSGYKIVPEMAADYPVDVTEKVKAEHPEFGIPESASSGFAYTIDLNPDATWEDGTVINADTYVESMKRLLDPDLKNYRATDRYDGNFVIAGAEAYANQGHKVPVNLEGMQLKLGVGSIEEVLKAVDDKTGYINWKNSFGAKYDFEKFPWKAGEEVKAEGFSLEANDEPVETPLTVKDLMEFYIKACKVNNGQDQATAEGFIPSEVFAGYEYADDVDYSTVGLYKSGDYQITLVLQKALSGFNLLYSLGTNWIVEPALYDSCKKQNGDVFTSNYYTSVDTTKSYGPYKLVSYQADKAMRFERNENWYGYKDGKHVYKDPTDGEVYPMYQTDVIDTLLVAEASTQKLMFLKGELATYGLQAEDFASYRNSEFCHATPQETVFFLILNGHKDAIAKREAAADFDKKTTDLETMTLLNFRKAVAVTYDKELFAATISPARSGGYGLLGTPFIYDPETGSRYRDTDQAKQVLCDFYSVDVDKFGGDLDAAVDSITGYDPEMARELYAEAFQDALDAGFITDADGDGKSDQTVTIEYSLPVDNDFMTKTIDYLNEKMNEVTKGTPFENKVVFTKSAPYGDEATEKLKQGLSDTTLSGWSGSLLNPFGVVDVYTNPAYQYDGAWFDSSRVPMTLKVDVNGEETEVSMSLRQWAQALNGTTIKVGANEYNFGEGIADVETRLNILAAIEGVVLNTYDYIPMLQNAGMSLLSQQMFYVVEEYNPVLGRGGIQYLKYNYNDQEWKDYVAEQGGELKY